VPPGLRYLTSSRETSSTAAKWWYAIEHWVLRFSKTREKREEERTHDDEIKAVLCAELGERADRAHFVRLEALRVRARVVQLDHAGADIYADEARDVRRERTRDLS